MKLFEAVLQPCMLFLLWTLWPAIAVKLDVDVAPDMSYVVKLDNATWLQSSPVRAYFDGIEYPSPVPVGSLASGSGTDDIGVFSSKTQKWMAGSVKFTTAIKVYAALGMAVFQTQVPGGANGTNASIPVVPGGWPGSQGNVKPIVAFPAWRTSSDAVGLASLDQLRWEDNFCYFSHGPALSLQGKTSSSMLGQGIYGGPVVLHDRKNLTANPSQSLTTLLFAPLDNLKHHSSYRNDTINSPWEMGVYSQVTSLPPGFTHRTLMVSGAGVTATVSRYGELAQKLAGTKRGVALTKDVVVNKLGYWTDSGAFYYADIPFGHNLTRMAETAGLGLTMEDVSVQVKQTLDGQKVPISYWQWDDWWYPGHPVYVWCVQDWSMVPDAFPSGLSGLHKKLGIPFLYYMPYWCMDNHTHAQQYRFLTPDDCGWDCQYTFVNGDQSKQFHTELFNKYKPLGMSNYEQDFMVTNFLKTKLYRTDLSAYESWARGLDAAAGETEIPIQFCMAMPSDIMMSVHLDWVTNARASDDYADGVDNLLNEPLAALLMWSLGVRPSKDNFWTSNVTNNPYQKGADNPTNPGSNVELNTIAATFSTGPVGISDKIGATNSTLIMASCTTDGMLLQPAKPLTASERMYTAIGQAGQCDSGCRGNLPQDQSGGALWNTYSTIDGTTVWYTVGVNIGGPTGNMEDIPLPLSATDLFPHPATTKPFNGQDQAWAEDSLSRSMLHREWHSDCRDGADAVATGCIATGVPDLRSTNRSMGVEDQGNDDLPFDLFTSQAAAGSGDANGGGQWVMLGELDKFTTLSSQRFSSLIPLTVPGGGFNVSLRGAAGELVRITALRQAHKDQGLAETDGGAAYRVVVKTVVIGTDGTGNLMFA